VDPSPGSLNEEAHVSNPLITEAEAGGSVDARSRLGGSGVSRHAAEEDERQHAAMTSSAGEMDDDSGGGSRLWSMIESERRSASLLERTSTGTGRGAEYAEQLARELDEMRTAQSKDRFDSAPESNRLSASVLSSSEWLEPSTAGAFSGLNAALEASREAVIVTDESNEPVRVISRAEMRRENLWHRATYILVLTPERDRIYIQKRTMTKDIHPGMYDAAAGGVVKAGETYDESAKRELFEELGLDLPLEPVGPIRYETDVTRVFGQVFVAIFDPFQEPRQRIRPQVEEVESVELVPIGEVLSQSEGRTFTEDTLLALRKFLETQSTEAASSSFVFSSKESGGGEQREQRSTTLHDNPKDTPQAESILENRSSTPGLTDESASASLASSPNVVATPMVVPPPAQTLVENPSPPPIESFFDDVDPASVEARALLQSLRPTP
jgi:8-oxo-dGTP pyrophosphatase MutT (NUDIX family)